MSQSMQDRVLGKITEIATRLGFEVIEMPNWANTGALSIQDDNFNELLKVKYDFQNSWQNMTLSMWRDGKGIPSQPGRSNYFDFYMSYSSGEEIREFFSRFSQELERQHVKVKC